MDFEWDETKSEVNRRKHGVAFEAALGVFQDADRVGWIDMRQDYGEERRNVVRSCRSDCPARELHRASRRLQAHIGAFGYQEGKATLWRSFVSLFPP